MKPLHQNVIKYPILNNMRFDCKRTPIAPSSDKYNNPLKPNEFGNHDTIELCHKP